MRILLVSVFSNHMFNWVLQLKQSGYDIHWIDVHDANTYVQRIDFVDQTVKWKRRLEYPGRFWIKKHFPKADNLLEKYNNRSFLSVFRKKFEEFQPDVVQSFELHSACVPILEIMKNNPRVKWIYSVWGNDMFYYQDDPAKLQEIKDVLPRVDYMFADCTRDYKIATKYGFKGEYLGTFPGGGGYELEYLKRYLCDFDTRKIILVKGYEHVFGRAISIMEAVLKIREALSEYEIVVFAATGKLQEFLKKPEFQNMKNLRVYGKIGRGEVLQLMGKSIIYIGNSISDGTPNTLLEAIIMECFPIQSDPGTATSEIIKDGVNGFLIKDPLAPSEIASHILSALKNPILMKQGIAYNTGNIKPKLERKTIQKKVIKAYQKIKLT